MTQRISREKGFSLVELALIIVIVAILAALAIVQLGDMTGMKASATARRLQSDIAYAQELAMTRNQRYRVYFNTAPAPASGYAVVNDSNSDGWGVTGAGEFAVNPAGGGDLSVTLDTGDYAGITITAVEFNGLYVEFNTLGVPFDGAGKLGAEKSATVNGGGTSQDVRVENETGKASTP